MWYDYLQGAMMTRALRRIAFSSSSLLVVAGVALAGCARVAEMRPPLDVRSDGEIVFVHRNKVVATILPTGGDTVLLGASESAIVAPRVSPAGDRVAFFDTGASGLPVSSTRVGLVVASMDTSSFAPSPQYFDLAQFDTDARLVVDDVVAPLWEPEGRSIVVAHNRGLERIAVSGERESLLNGGAVTALALSPDGGRIVCSDGRNLILLDRSGDGSERLLDDDFVPRFGKRRIRALSFSPEGERLAFGVGREVCVLDVRSRMVRRVFEAPLGVYWLGWLPGGEQIVLLYGREDRRTSVHSPWGADRSGKYTLAVIGEQGGLRRTLYSAHLVDVRHATPDLSPDGRYVCLSATDGGAREILIVAVDGSGEAVIDHYGPISHASWFPFR